MNVIIKYLLSRLGFYKKTSFSLKELKYFIYTGLPDSKVIDDLIDFCRFNNNFDKVYEITIHFNSLRPNTISIGFNDWSVKHQSIKPGYYYWFDGKFLKESKEKP